MRVSAHDVALCRREALPVLRISNVSLDTVTVCARTRMAARAQGRHWPASGSRRTRCAHMTATDQARRAGRRNEKARGRMSPPMTVSARCREPGPTSVGSAFIRTRGDCLISGPSRRPVDDCFTGPVGGMAVSRLSTQYRVKYPLSCARSCVRVRASAVRIRAFGAD
jgi:hypothetical protein